ncbi:MAG: regulatory protein FmdB family [Marmoricola sp.]|nr:regulatory protein FmdB family [Marmoricola sp.]
MPTYQYSCTECGHFFEIQQSFSEDSLTVCPVCEGRLRKVFNAVGVVFKGSGFYRNDSREASKPGGGASTSPATSGADKPSPEKSTSTGSEKPSSTSSGSTGSTGSSGGSASTPAAGS